MTEPTDPQIPTEAVAAIRRSDAILYVIVRPALDGIPGEVAIDWGANGVTHRDAAILLRNVASEWEEIADTAGEPASELELETTRPRIETMGDTPQ